MEMKTGDSKEKNQMTKASAGTLESGDIFIQIAPSEEDGLQIALDSTVAYQFGEQIKTVIAETLHGLVYLLGKFACRSHDDAVNGIFGKSSLV